MRGGIVYAPPPNMLAPSGAVATVPLRCTDPCLLTPGSLQCPPKTHHHKLNSLPAMVVCAHNHIITAASVSYLIWYHVEQCNKLSHEHGL